MVLVNGIGLRESSMNAKEFNEILREARWTSLLNSAWETTGCGSLFCTCGEPGKPDPLTGKSVSVERIRRQFFRWVKEGNPDIWDMRVAQRKWKNFLKSKNVQ